MWPQFVISWELRQSLTRLLCWGALLANLAGYLFLVAFIGTLFVGAHLALWLFVPAVVAIVATMMLSAILEIWRCCDACGFRLYGQRFAGFIGVVWRIGEAPRPPDYRAKLVLQSLWLGALIEMATTGKTHCQWCGHADGEPRIVRPTS